MSAPAVRARPRRRWLPRALARIAAILVAIGLALVCGELLLPVPPGLRGAIWRQARGSIEEYEPGKLQTVANFIGEQTVGEGRQAIRHNSLGMRGDELTPKRAAERRVLFLGDSVTYGTGVQVDETFAHQLGPLLSLALGGEVRCGIAASPGFGIRDQAPFLRRVRDAFVPDLVVSCVFVENDLYDDLQVERGVFAGYPVFQASQVRLLRQSWRARLAARFTLAFQFEQLVAKYTPRLAMDLAGATLTAEELALWEGVAPDQSVLFLEQAQPTPALTRLVRRSTQALRELQRTAAPTPVVVVLIPSYVQYVLGLFENLAPGRPGEGEHRLGAIQQRLTEATREFGLPTYDLLAPLRAQRDVAALLIPNDFHFTPAGHRLVAELLAPWLALHLRP